MSLTIARHHGWDVIEVNASDTRNAEEIESKIGAAAKQASLFFRGKVILVDEVDGISGQYDRGGIPTLVKIIESTAFPVVMTATDVDDSSSPLSRKCRRLSFLTSSLLIRLRVSCRGSARGRVSSARISPCLVSPGAAAETSEPLSTISKLSRRTREP